MNRTPNTPANGGQILTDERIDKVMDTFGKNGLDYPSRTRLHDFARAIEADLRAALAAPAIPTVDRNATYDQSLIEILEILRPNYGDVGSRDVDVIAKRSLINHAIAILSAAAPTVVQPAAQVAVPQFSYLGADGRYLDTQGWSVDNDDVGSFAAAPIARNGKVVALVFSDDPCFEDEIREICGLLVPRPATPTDQSTDKTAEGK